MDGAASAVAGAIQVQNAFHVIAVVLALTAYLYPRSVHVVDYQEYDFIVVGGGTAGVVVAARLSECGQFRVLLIEAGGDPTAETMFPALFSFLTQTPLNWNYTAQKDGYTGKCHETGTLNLTSGKVLGGGSTVNYLMYVRGCPGDYDYWERAAGDPTWNWNGVYPYFIKSERLEDEDILRSRYRTYHGTRGWLGVSKANNMDIKEYLEAFHSVGNPTVLDINGKSSLGYTPTLLTVSKGIRESTAYALLSKIKYRSNLDVLKNAFVTQITFDGRNQANGVKVTTEEQENLTLVARKEVIISAGTIRSPQLLMLSGIGPRKHLESFGIKVRSDLPVGFNYQDHVSLLTPIQLEESNASPKPLNPFKFPAPLFTGYVALNKTDECPDYQTINVVTDNNPNSPMALCYLNFGFKYDLCHKLYEASKGRKILMSNLNLLHPSSTGRLLLNTTDPFDPPLVFTGMLSDERDLERLVDSVIDFRRVLNSPYFRSVNAKMVDFELSKCDEFVYGSRNYWRCYILCLSTTIFHYSGTCSLGKVVDSHLRVLGVGRLRVVDASTMPYLPSGNTNAPVIMLAEKAADFIKADHRCKV